MAHIVRFSVSGLAGRSVRHERELDRHINVFFGANGSGKTSLLRILDAAMSGDASPLISVPFEQAEVTVFSETFQTEFVRSVDRQEIMKGGKGRRHTPKQTVMIDELGRAVVRHEPSIAWTTAPTVPPDSRGRWSHVFLPISRMYPLRRTQFSAQYPTFGEQQTDSALEEQLNDTFAEVLRAAWTTYFSAVLAEVRQIQAQGLANTLQAVLSPKTRRASSALPESSVAYKRVASFLQRQGSLQILPSAAAFAKRYNDDPQLRNVVSDIDEVEERIAAALAPRTKLQRMISKMFGEGKRVVFGDRDIEVELDQRSQLSLGLLSSGEKQVLRLLVETLRAGPNTLLIDEPELSMHVDWQRELLGSMRQLNPEVQVIVATHSPEIMAEVADDRIWQL